MAQNSHHSELICYLPIFNLPRLLFFIEFQNNLVILCLSRCEKEFTPLIFMQEKKECQKRDRTASHMPLCSALSQANTYMDACWGTTTLSSNYSGGLYSPLRWQGDKPKTKSTCFKFSLWVLLSSSDGAEGDGVIWLLPLVSFEECWFY